MNNWELQRIDNVVDIRRGASPRPIDAFLSEEGMPWVKISDATASNGRYIYETKQFIIEDGIKNSVIVNPEDLIISNSATPALPKILKIRACVHDGWLIVSNYRGITRDFLYYSILYNRKWLLNQGNGSIFKNLKTDILKEFKIKIPPVNIQNQVSSVLKAIEDKIELNNRINAELEAMVKTLYGYWFVQFDFPIYNQDGTLSGAEGYKTSGGKMEWNEELKRVIPEGWKVEPLFKAMDVQYGFPFSTSKFTDEVTDKPVIRIRDILENTISTYTTEEVDDKYRLKQNDLLIGMDGNFHLNFWDKDGAYLNQRSVRIRAKKDSEISNLQAYFELKPYIKARENNVSRTTVGHLSDKDLKRLFLISPSRSDLFKPKNLFENSLSEIISNRLQNQKLTELRDWLLPMLMNGQVKVN